MFAEFVPPNRHPPNRTPPNRNSASDIQNGLKPVAEAWHVRATRFNAGGIWREVSFFAIVAE